MTYIDLIHPKVAVLMLSDGKITITCRKLT